MQRRLTIEVILTLAGPLFKMDRGNGAPWWLRISGKMQSKLELKLPISVGLLYLTGNTLNLLNT